MTSRTRRSVLAAVGASLATAGCVADPDGTDAEESTTSERPTEATTRSTTDGATTDGMTTDGTTTDRTTTDDSTTTGNSTVYASKEPDPDHRITLNNDAEEARTIHVRIVRSETDETVFEETREMPPGTEVEVYNLKQADPEDIEPFRVCGELVGSDEGTATTVGETTVDETTVGETAATATTASETTASDESDARDCVTLRTNACYGHAHVTAQEDDSLTVIYSIC